MPARSIRSAIALLLLVSLWAAGCRRGPTIVLRFPSERVFLNSVFAQVDLYELLPNEEEICLDLVLGNAPRVEDATTGAVNVCSFEDGSEEFRGIHAGRFALYAVVTDAANVVTLKGCRVADIEAKVDVVEITVTPTPGYVDVDPQCASVAEKCDGVACI